VGFTIELYMMNAEARRGSPLQKLSFIRNCSLPIILLQPDLVGFTIELYTMNAEASPQGKPIAEAFLLVS